MISNMTLNKLINYFENLKKIVSRMSLSIRKCWFLINIMDIVILNGINFLNSCKSYSEKLKLKKIVKSSLVLKCNLKKLRNIVLNWGN